MDKKEQETLAHIAQRASKLFDDATGKRGGYPVLDAFMDLSAAHKVCPLNLADLLAADDGNFGHDVFGIRSHLNRRTGKLEDCFLPRFSR